MNGSFYTHTNLFQYPYLYFKVLVGIKGNQKNNHWPLLYYWLLEVLLINLDGCFKTNTVQHNSWFAFEFLFKFAVLTCFGLQLDTDTNSAFSEMWLRTEVVCSGTLVLTRSPYLFMAMVNGLMPMKNLWLLSSMILLFPSQMILLCMSSCTGREQTTHHRDTHVMWISRSSCVEPSSPFHHRLHHVRSSRSPTLSGPLRPSLRPLAVGRTAVRTAELLPAGS